MERHTKRCPHCGGSGRVAFSGAPRAKGHKWERDVANIFRAAGYEARRGLQGRDGSEAADVEVTGLSWWIECKAGRGARDPVAALEQAERASGGRPCVAVCKADRQEPTATVRLFVLAAWIQATYRDALGHFLMESPTTMSLANFVRLCVATEPPPERAP